MKRNVNNIAINEMKEIVESQNIRNSVEHIELNFSCKQCKNSYSSKPQLYHHIKDHHPKVYKCKECEIEFKMTIELEKHILHEHSEKKKHVCDVCKMEFIFKWRMQKHVKDHEKTVRKTCHFYNNDKTCPFYEIGCKFKHEKAVKCKFAEKCIITKCQYRHA